MGVALRCSVTGCKRECNAIKWSKKGNTELPEGWTWRVVKFKEGPPIKYARCPKHSGKDRVG